jgi:hypothetical protein
MTAKTKKSVAATKAAEPEAKPEVSKQSPFQGVGIIATIVSLVESADKKTGITKEQILDALAVKFPERDKARMGKTVQVQVPARITKERFKVIKLPTGGFCKG